MKNRFRNDKQRLSLMVRIMLPIFIGILLITFLSIFYSYEYIRDQTWDMYYGNIAAKMTRTQTTASQKINDMLRAAHIFRSAGNVELYALYPQLDPETLKGIFQEVSSYMKAFSGISSVYVVNQQSENMLVFNSSTTFRFYDKTQYYDQSAIELLNNQELKRSMIYPRTILNASGAVVHYYSVVGFDGYIGKDGPLTAVVLNYSGDYLSKAISEDRKGIDSPVLLGADGKALTDNGYFALFDDLNRFSFIRDILAREGQGYIECNVDEVDYFAMFTGADAYGNRIMQLVPFSELNKPIDLAQHGLLILILVMVTVAVILFSVSAYMTSKPITALVKTLRSNEKELWRDSQSGKDRLLRDVLWFDGRQHATSLSDEWKRLGVSFDVKARVTLMLIYLDDYAEIKKARKQLELEALLFGAANIIQEITSATGPNEVVIYHQNGTIYLFLSPAAQEPHQIRASLANLSSAIASTLTETLGLSVTIFYSSDTAVLPAIETIRQKLQLAARYRPFLGAGKIIDVDTLPVKADHESYGELIKKLNQYESGVADGDAERAISVLRDIFDTHCTPDELIFLWSMLMNAYFEKILVRYPPEISSPAADKIAQAPVLENFKSPTELFEWLSSLTASLCRALAALRGDPQDDLVLKTNELIRKEYANPDLNVAYLAERLGVSSAHLGRTYRKRTSASILDRIIEYRVNAACGLLTDTNLSTKEISEQCGYLNYAYFCQLFKKTTGVTPASYRSMHRK